MKSCCSCCSAPWGRCATGSISNVWIGSKKSEGKMFTGLLILSIVGFIYLMYVLVKPEKF